MQFKVDENLPAEVAELLRANMHDAMTIFDQLMVGELDPKMGFEFAKGPVDVR